MKDRRMKALGLFTIISLTVCLIASGMVFDADPSDAATSSLKWTQISIPNGDEMQLYPGSDVGPMAAAPDDTTVFAAVQDEGTGDWALLKSSDGAISWRGTGLTDAMAAIAPADTGDIVALQLSPNWNTDGRLFAATANRVYLSEDRGSSFTALAVVPGTVYDAGGTDDITSIALGKDSSNDIVLAVGTADSAGWVDGGDVFVFDMGVWTAQSVGAYGVLAVGLSPSYATDSTIIAVVADNAVTMLRTKLGSGLWGVAVNDATFKDQDGLDFVAYRASLGFTGDYLAASGSGTMRVFVGLSAAGPRGDVFSIQWAGWPAVPTVTDSQVRGYQNPPTNTIPTETNIWSMAVSDGGAGTTIIVGTETVDPSALPTPPGQFLIYNSLDSGASWAPSQAAYTTFKQPTGQSQATVAMASSVAYAGTFGDQSAVSIVGNSNGGGDFTSWNQRGLIDTVIDEITDISPSDGYFSDGTIHITTLDVLSGNSSLWRTRTEGRRWERLYCSTLTGTPVTCIFDTVRLVGSDIILVESNNTGIVPSDDGGITFQVTRYAPQPITAFTVADGETYYAGDANGDVWQSTDSGVTWSSLNTGMIGIKVIDLVLHEGYIIAGTDYGTAIFRRPGGSEWFLLGRPLGGAGNEVRIVWDLYDEYFIYAGVQGGASNQGIWRYDISEEGSEDWDFDWEQIADASNVGNTSSIACDEQNGILYAVSTGTGTGWRSVNPRTVRDEPVFTEIDEGLNPPVDTVMRNLKLVSGSTVLFAVGGPSYTQLWTTSDELTKAKLLSPEDGAIAGVIMEDEEFLGRAIVNLEWKEITGANTYEVKLAYDEGFVSPIDDISYYYGGTIESEGLLKVVYPWLGTKYYWRVRVIDPYLSQWSDVWSFTTPLGPAPSAPECQSPTQGETGVSRQPLLQWNSSVDARGYELILAKSCDFEVPVLDLSGDDEIMDTAYQVAFNLDANTNYCWKVRGVNEITHSPWSDTGTFTTVLTAEAEDADGLPVWVWVIIALSAVLILAIVVLIVRSRAG
jgi:hypothetical protein